MGESEKANIGPFWDMSARRHHRYLASTTTLRPLCSSLVAGVTGSKNLLLRAHDIWGLFLGLVCAEKDEEGEGKGQEKRKGSTRLLG